MYKMEIIGFHWKLSIDILILFRIIHAETKGCVSVLMAISCYLKDTDGTSISFFIEGQWFYHSS